MDTADNKALIAMGGGVDSSVAAWLMKNDGYDCIGAVMKLYTNEDIGLGRDSGCCSYADVSDARRVAELLGIPFYVFNFTQDFAGQVIKRFAEAYRNGHTPNPCIDCNRYMKFERFLSRACEIDCACIATGHYARIVSENGRYLLKKGVDLSKDQSYVLYAMTQEQLSRTRFPLGGLTKPGVRDIASEQGFVNARKKDSQDICFAPDGDYAAFIEKHTGAYAEKGRFVDLHGNDLGEHNGVIRYTIGQRRGLGISSANPLYVCEVNPGNNTVVVGAEENLYSRELLARDINLICVDKLDAPLRVGARIRYSQREQPATVWQLEEDVLRVEFDAPQRAITKGQAVVLYDGEVVVGGGTIAADRSNSC